MTEIAVGARVRFRDDSPQRRANAGTTYVVDGDPRPDNDGALRTGNPPRMFVSLVAADDLGKPYSRQGRRTGYVDALQLVEA